MDVDHEKLLSGDVNFKWQRDFTAFTAVREEFLSTPLVRPALARYLKCRGFDCLGTERLTRKNIPEDVKEMKKNCERGTIIACHSGDVMVLAGCKILSMISTFHDNSTYTGTSAGEECESPYV
ncbi:PiggyBac transposable element-derived protein 4 [Eumeta japonica]|uniref:PiggyBac transposable element-derived protein 4 n=1 Tax=Eumeta variegata TaxID=151549 RepID=A0A4C1UXK3_EUMVA|nr:PiggyBac transposable element-derived protein 4 [Eumeta japonica]